MADEVVVEEAPRVEGKADFLKAFDATTGQIKDTAVKPVEITKVEAPAPPLEKTETVIPAEKTEAPAPPAEATKPTETVAKVEKTVEVKPEKFDWKDALKKADRNEALKELGLDEFEIGLLDYRKGGGDTAKYLEAKGRDWSKVPDMDVLRYDLRQQFPDLDAESFEILAEKRIQSRFPAEEEFSDEKEKKVSLLERKLEADALRKKYKEADEKFTIADRKADTEQATKLEEATRAKQDFISTVDESAVTQKLRTDKKITLGEGDAATLVDIDPETILNFVKTDNKFFTMFVDEKGELDLDLLYATINYGLNRKAVEKTLTDRGKSLGIKAEVDDLHNIPKEKTPVPGEKKESLLEAFTNRGKDRPV